MASKKIALLVSPTLGDGLVFTILCESLHKNGYCVTFFNNAVYQLSDYFEYVVARPIVDTAQLIDQLLDFDLVWVSEEYPRDDILAIFQACPKKVVLFKIATMTDRFALHNSQSRAVVRDHPVLQCLHNSSGYSISHHDRQNTVVQNIADFCRNHLELDNVTDQVTLCLPAQWVKNNKRVIIQPGSSTRKKNWSPAKYLRLAKKIHKAGFEVVFSACPDNFTRWQSFIDGRFQVALWDLNQLARALYECSLFIGSDSGPGHLASILNTKTLTVFIRKRSYYTWRPGWSEGYIVHPVLPLSIIKAKHHLRAPLSVRKVWQTCSKALELL